MLALALQGWHFTSLDLQALNSVLNVTEIVILAWIGGQQAASARERERRRKQEDPPSHS